MANRLAGETSPYLRQHAGNPVDWYPWGEEALERARALNRPLLVSIGYSACHWCHVMERESFEDSEVAALMNETLVCVKVDREERPDVDAICMEACQTIHGHGGWPLNVFLTPDQQPFFAGTYFPPEPRGGMASWSAVVRAVGQAWAERPQEVRTQAAELSAAIGRSVQARQDAPRLTLADLEAAVAALQAGFDPRWGGFGGAPKFPPHCVLAFLLAVDSPAARTMAVRTLEAMASGGIYDQVGGGFARYAVDATWTVPHFEKMLYDNALLARAYLHGWQRTGEPRLAEVCRETLDFLLRELRDPEGGFCAALDADSEGVEGKFYVWSRSELIEALADPELAEAAVRYFGVSEAGNFEGLSVLTARGGDPPPQLPEIRRRLYAARAARVRPGLDDKRLTGWNALAIAALAEAGAVLGAPAYIEAARTCASLLLDGGSELRRTGRVPAFLDDYAYLIDALVTLYAATFQARWYHEAVRLADEMIDRFGDREHGGFFTTPVGHPVLVARRKDLEDAPIPSASSAAALALLRLARLAGETDYERWALSVLRAHGPLAVRHPGAFGHLLQAIHFWLGDVREVAVIGEGPDGPLARAVRREHRPLVVLAGSLEPVAEATGAQDGVPLLAHRGLVGGAPAAYVCERFACQAPLTDPEALAAALSDP
jgi:uncharacterized protein YyaL (SSP411 family)